MMSPNIAGALMMMASMASFTLNDTLIKATGGAVPLFQLLFLRGLLATLLIYLLAGWLKGLVFQVAPRDRWLIALRSVAEVAAAYFFLSALFEMPLANITAILQVLPLSVTLGSALIYREQVGWRRMAAIGVGFLGVLLILRPGAEGFSIWSAYALLAVFFVTIRDLAVRGMSPSVPSMTVTFAASLLVTLAAGLASLSTPWVAVSGVNAIYIFGSSVFILGGYFFSVQVMRTGDISYIAPFRYTGLIWALILGWLVFGHWPAPLTLLGAGIVVATGLFTLYRERAVRTRKAV